MGEKKYFTEALLLIKTHNLQDFKDWLHWHLDIIGFDHCHIFDNESTVDIKSVCKQYGDKISYELIVGWPNQYELYNRYINNESKAWWVLPIDDDEYLWMKNFNNVNKMLLHYQHKFNDMNKLSIRWKNMFPKDPQADRNNVSLMDWCTEENDIWAEYFDGGNKPVKTFVKTTNKIIYSIKNKNQTHNPINNNKPSYMCNGDQLVGNWYYGTTDDDVKLLHYQYKSKNEWITKCKTRKRVSTHFGTDKDYYQLNKLNLWQKLIPNTVNTTNTTNTTKKLYSILSFGFGNYDLLREPLECDPLCEYIYVTNNKNLKSNIWKIIYKDFNTDDDVYKSFYVRYNPFEFVNTDCCIVLDSSMQIKKSLNKLYIDFIKSSCDIGLTINTWLRDLENEITYWKNTFSKATDNKQFNNEFYDNLKNFLTKTNMLKYKGNLCAGVKIVKNTKQTMLFHNIIFDYLKILGTKDKILRLDQPVISVVLEKYFNDFNTFVMCRQIFQNDFIRYCYHNKNEEFPIAQINYDNLWFKNKQIKDQLYLLT